ncbi:MAG TPA: hypothetical protein VG055_31975 [Planctomycetaceae bacterium]|jgi:hypothetical protein|nr:hypothetical protein [Planctomycetaceae bacterium]
MLEFDDIQHILLTRAPALTGRYEFLSFRDWAGVGRDRRAFRKPSSDSCNCGHRLNPFEGCFRQPPVGL